MQSGAQHDQGVLVVQEVRPLIREVGATAYVAQFDEASQITSLIKIDQMFMSFKHEISPPMGVNEVFKQNLN
tara:strand:- start:1645 stop:1860 length:216 start_codon:yes stop_codon:yes gene_type:complete